MDFETRYKKLNDAQRKAVDTIDGPLMVIAGPGTGKTELLSMRAANILKLTDTLPENILCLTFTDSGAGAMRERLREIIGPDAYKVAIHTFHSFGSEVIGHYPQYFYQGADFRPADELSTYELLREIFDSLDHTNPLASKLNGEYTYLPDVLVTISELKKSGLTNEELLSVLDANDEVLDSIEKDIDAVFSERISKSTASKLVPLAHRLAELSTPPLPPSITPLSNVIARSLSDAIDSAESDESTKPITAWKNKWCEKDEAGRFVFKDRNRSVKLRALSYIYYQYLVRMQEIKHYDFDDMVLRVVHASEVFPELRLNLQERYLYIMVDEFQDTNLAQMRILSSLTTLATGDEPNLMVVGDDDQAIYSFQGAELSNLVDFSRMFDGIRRIVLTENYRSAPPILEKAREVIVQADGRLESVLEIDKTLTPHHAPSKPAVTLDEYARVDDERSGLVQSIKDDIKAGVKPSDIAVLARRHHELIKLLPYFAAEDIAVNYERRDNVLESDIVTQLYLLGRIIVRLSKQDFSGAEALLPELLAHPAWNISTDTIWKLSLGAYTHRHGWLEEMPTVPPLIRLVDWLKELARLSLIEPAERMIDLMTGTPDSETRDFTSPLYGYFFDEEKRVTAAEDYLAYLEALRTIRSRLREYRPGETLKLSEFMEFVELHKRLGRGITSVRVRSDAPLEAINLMTAHKSKGLEFKHVYIHGAIDSAWGQRVRSRSRLISYPENLPLAPAGDTVDERLRLFFVAMTRARDTLHISYGLADDNDKATLRASFLSTDEWTATVHPRTDDARAVRTQLEREWYASLVSLPSANMRELLASQLNQYKLSATHLCAFLDVSRGGPQRFLVHNLLRFPESMSPDAAYGSAMHRALQRAHTHLVATHKKKPVEDVLSDFEQALGDMRLAETDVQRLQRRGTEALQVFLAANYESFTETQRAELGFAHQQSIIKDAHLTGALDLVDIDTEARAIRVTDYKTGKPATSWKGKSDIEKKKLHKYRQQLLFYKLLVEHSRDYHTYTVNQGALQFVEPTKGGSIIQLELDYNPAELERFTKLVEIVWDHIIRLDLPDTSSYPPTYSGLVAFEDDLLAGKL